jgi:hypothetical protein
MKKRAGWCVAALVAAVMPMTAMAQAPSPELISALTKDLGATADQAQGAAGALFGLAKTRLKPEEFTQVANAVPGMDSLLKAAPAAEPTKKSGSDALLQAAAGATGLGGLAAVAGSFTKLGLKPELAMKAVPLLVNHVAKAGGAEVGKLLAGALK